MEEEFQKFAHVSYLKAGDIIRGSAGIAYTVVEVFNDRAIAIRLMDVTNPQEWEVLRKVNQNKS